MVEYMARMLTTEPPLLPNACYSLIIVILANLSSNLLGKMFLNKMVLQFLSNIEIMSILILNFKKFVEQRKYTLVSEASFSVPRQNLSGTLAK